MRLVPVSGEELIKILYKRGFVIKRRKGSHVQLEDAEGRRVTVPVHPGRIVGRRLWKMNQQYLEKLFEYARDTGIRYLEKQLKGP